MIWVALLLLPFCLLRAQSSPLDSIQAPYEDLNTANIPSGILWDRAFYLPGLFADKEKFQGRTYSSVGNQSIFDEFVNMANMAAYDDSIAMRPDTFYSRREAAIQKAIQDRGGMQNAEIVPISLMNYVYQELDSLAVQNGLIGYDTATQKLYDIAGQNPYVDKYLVSGALTYNTLHGVNVNSGPSFVDFTVKFVIPENLYLSNNNEAPISMMVDFDDGAGFISTTFDQMHTVSYRKNFTNFLEPLELRKVITVRFRYPNRHSLDAKIDMISSLPYEAPDVTLANDDIRLTNSCQVPRDPENYIAKARTYVKYGQDPNGLNILDKPVIFVEGFDSGGDPYGTQTWAGFSTGFFATADNPDVLPQLRKLPHLVDTLNAYGYDVLIVDFEDGVDDMRNNGAYVINLIQWVNEQLAQIGSDEQLVVAGASMGGIISRYALLKLEDAGCCHNTRFYATLDSPHRGANIPLGVQAFARNMGYKLPIEDFRKKYEHVIRSKAAMQLMQYHINSTNNALNGPLGNPWANRVASIANGYHTSFFDELERMGGQPKQCYKFAIVNGSVTAEPGDVSPGDLIMDMGMDIPAPAYYPADFRDWMLIGSKVYATANTPNHILTTDKGVAAGMLSWTKYTLNYFTYQVGWLARALSFGYSDPYFEDIMYGLRDYNNNVFVWHTRQHDTIRLMDGCPGSSTNTMYLIAEEINNAAGGINLMRAAHGSHTFIPTYSALDIDESYLNNSIRNDLDGGFANSPFDNSWYYVPRTTPESTPNDRHVEIRDETINNFMAEIENTRNVLSTAGVSYLHTKIHIPFNFGKPELRFIQQLEVGNQGLLVINHRNYHLGFNTQIGPYPRSHTSFTAYTHGASCHSSYIIVNDGGTVELGDSINVPQNNVGNLVITSGTYLELENGSTLRINTGSTLTIEPGAELIIHPGATIELDGQEAILEIQGKLTLKDNTIFAPNGSGFVRIANPAGESWHTAFEFGSNAQIELIGANTGHKVLEIIGEVQLPPSLGLLHIEDGRVELSGSAILGIWGAVSSNNVVYTDLELSAPYEGVRLYGQAHAHFNASDFFGGRKQLQALQTYYGNSLSIEDCAFNYPQLTGLYAEGAGINLTDCRFKGGQIGLDVLNATLPSSIKTSIFEDQTNRGIRFKGQSAVALNITQTDVKRTNVGILVEDVNLRMTCSRSINNQSIGLEAIGSYIDISNEAHNTLTGNQTGLKLHYTMDLRMADGENHLFNNSIYYIEGSFDNNHRLGNALSVDIANNNLPGASNALPISMYTQNGLSVGLHNHSNNASQMTWSCYSQPSPYPGIVLEYPSFKVINTAGFTNTYYSDAFYSAISEISFEDIAGNDLAAISTLSSLLEIPLNEPTENELALREYGLRMMMTALSNAYEQELIPLNRAVENEAENGYLHMVTDELNQRLIENSGVNQELEYELNIAKAHLYRMAEHYDYALTTLGEAQITANYTDLIETDYWRCVCEAEEALLHEELTVEAYLEQKQYCQSQLNAKRAPATVVKGITTAAIKKHKSSIIASLMPNPAEQYVQISLSETVDECSFAVRDVQGRLIQLNVLRENEKTFRLNVEALAKGVYMISLYEKGKLIENQKLIKK